MSQKNKKNLIIAVFSVLVLAILILFVLLPLLKKTKAPTRESSNVERTSQESTDQVSKNPSQANANTNGRISASDTPANNFDYKGQPISSVPSTTNSNLESSDPYYYYELGQNSFSAGNYEDAIKNFDKAISMNSTNANFYIGKSNVQIAEKQEQAALDTINAGLAKMPGDDSLLSQLDFIKNAVK